MARGISHLRKVPLPFRLALFALSLWYAPWAEADPSFLRGWTPLADFQAELDSNLLGGAAVGSTGTAYFQGGVSWDSNQAGVWSGGRFVATYLGVTTGQPDQYVGDIQGVSGLTTPYDISRLYKLFFRQNIGPATVRLGLMNANDYFDDVGLACDLFNASYGTFPNWSQNLEGSSTYPFSSLGTMVAFQNQQQADLAAVLGPTTAGFYGIGEYRWESIGMHWGTFLVGGGAPDPINPVPWYVGGGLRVKGYLPSAPKDAISLGFSRASLRGLPHAETSYELTSIFGIIRGVHIQPDIQVVTHPSGTLPTALVGIVRLDFNLVKLVEN